MKNLIPTERSYRVLMTNSILEGSDKKSYADNLAFLQSKQYEIPSLLMLVAQTILTFVSSPKMIYSNSDNFTYCSERQGDLIFNFGGFPFDTELENHPLNIRVVSLAFVIGTGATASKRL